MSSSRRSPHSFGHLRFRVCLVPEAIWSVTSSSGIEVVGPQSQYVAEIAHPLLFDLIVSWCQAGIELPIDDSISSRTRLLFRAIEKDLQQLGLLRYTLQDREDLLGWRPTPFPGNLFSIEAGFGYVSIAHTVAVYREKAGYLHLAGAQDRQDLSLSVRGERSFYDGLAENGRSEVISPFLSVLVAAGLLQRGDGAQTKDDWMPLDRIYHRLSRPPLASNREIGANSYQEGNEILLTSGQMRIDHDLLNALARRRSRRPPTRRMLRVQQLEQFSSTLLANHSGQRNFPSAGGFYDMEFLVALGRSDSMFPGLYRLTCSAESQCDIKLIGSERRALSIIANAAQAMGNSVHFPDAVVIVGIDNKLSAQKYGSRAYRLALLTGGALLQVMYIIAEALGLSGCAIGTGSQDAEAAIRDEFPDYILLVEFALSG